MQNANGAPSAAGDQQAKIPNYQLIYPLPWPAARDFSDPNTKQEEFGHDRGDKNHKRAHAAIDLIAPVNTPVLAMAAGTVLRIAAFYQNTEVIEIAHPGLGIMRYGELSMLSVNNSLVIMKGQHVRPGQVIGLVGRRKEFRNGKIIYAQHSMLHLELYSDWQDDNTQVHRLTDPANRAYDNLPDNLADKNYERRHDLLDPTAVVGGARVKGLGNSEVYDALNHPHKPALSLAELLNRAVMQRVQNTPLSTVTFKK